jgi:hypothetical protein
MAFVTGCLVLEDFEGVQVLPGQDMVHANQPLAKLDVESTVGQTSIQYPMSGPLVHLK